MIVNYFGQILPAMSQKLIMLVDDNDTDNFINKVVVKNSGHASDIIVQNSGKKALQYFAEHMENLSKIPDLLFLDINMPVVDGFAFLYEFDEYPASVKTKCHIVVLSSSDNRNDIERILRDNNVKSYFTKPLSQEIIKEVVNTKMGNTSRGSL